MDRRSFFRVALIGAGGITVAPLAKKYFFLFGNPLAPNPLALTPMMLEEAFQEIASGADLPNLSEMNAVTLGYFRAYIESTAEGRKGWRPELCETEYLWR